MKKYFILFFFVVLISHPCLCQEILPGGFFRPVLWEKIHQNPTTGKIKLSTVGKEYPMQFNFTQESRPVYLNNNPSGYLTQGGSTLIYCAEKLNKMTFFLVYQVEDTIKEKNI